MFVPEMCVNVVFSFPRYTSFRGSIEKDTGGVISRNRRERFATSKCGILSVNLSRFRLRDIGKTSGSGISQSLDVDDSFDTNDESIDEMRVKRTSSAPSGEAKEESAQPPSSISEVEDPNNSSTQPTLGLHVCLQVDSEKRAADNKKEVAHSPAPSTVSLPSSLKGIIQPLKSSTNTSGWL